MCANALSLSFDHFHHRVLQFFLDHFSSPCIHKENIYTSYRITIQAQLTDLFHQQNIVYLPSWS